jgi:hypothetical protein
LAKDRGYGNYDEHEWLKSWHDHAISKLICECGADVTYGKGCPDEYHSDYCPKRKPVGFLADDYLNRSD